MTCKIYDRYVYFAWMVCEVFFLPYYYMLYQRLHEANDDLSHFANEKGERMKLVVDCFTVTASDCTITRLKSSSFSIRKALRAASQHGSTMPHEYVRKVIEGWFLDTPLIKVRRGNFLSWTGWPFTFILQSLQQLS